MKKYDFDLIITDEELKTNRERTIERDRKMKRKYHLRNWVKVTLLVITLVVVGVMAVNRFNNVAAQCDKATGYTCSLDEVNNFNK